MDAWQDILRTALVGTERQAPALPALPALPGALGATLTALPKDEPERALLSAASVLSLYQAAGHLPASSGVVASATTSPPETLPPVPPRAATHLPDLISGDHAKLLPEFLTACAAANRRIPHRHLPALLDRAAAQRDLRDAVLKVIGTRGHWLMSLNPAWNFDASPDDSTPDTWQTGTRDQRLAYLKRLRAADPAAARGLVRGTWAQETPEDRAAILATFATNLSPDDEPLLEESLDDRRKEVRTAAADLLAGLPNSQLVSRMLARLTPLLKIEVAQRGKVMKLVAGSKNKVTIDLTPPDACDNACQRDGVDPKPPAHSGIGEKAWLLEEMLAAVPPTVWTKDTGATPDDLLAAALATDYPTALVDGWTRAAARHPDPAWSRALLAYHLDPPATKKKKQPNYVAMEWQAKFLQDLLRALPAKDVESALIAALQSDSDKLATHPAFPILESHDRPWGRDLSLAVLNRLRAELSARSDYALYEWVQSDLGRLLSPDTAPVACDPAWDPPSFWQSPVSKMRTVLQFRHDMLKSLVEQK